MVYLKDKKEAKVAISFEKKIPKRRMTIKRNPYISILNEKEGGVMEPDKRATSRRLRREHRKSIKKGLEE